MVRCFHHRGPLVRAPLAPEHEQSGSGGGPTSSWAHTVLRGYGPGAVAPAVGEGVDEDEASTGLGVGGRVLELREAVTPGVGDLDAEGGPDDVQGEPEVPAGDAAVGDGVGREFGHDVRRRVQGEAPGAELLGGEETGEAGSSGRG